MIQQYQLKEKLPVSVLTRLQQGLQGKRDDNKESFPQSSTHPVFDTAQTILVGNNELAVEAAANKAKELNYHPIILGTQIVGEAKEIANVYIAMARYLQQQSQAKHKNPYAMAPSLPVALIAGGEMTVSLSSMSGKGGRNQELALSAALQMESMGMRNVVLASVGTDGTDGPTDAAGAIVDGTTVIGTVSTAQDALRYHNAYAYFDASFSSRSHGPLIKTGPTGTNVADVFVVLVHGIS